MMPAQRAPLSALKAAALLVVDDIDAFQIVHAPGPPTVRSNRTRVTMHDDRGSFGAGDGEGCCERSEGKFECHTILIGFPPLGGGKVYWARLLGSQPASKLAHFSRLLGD
jgi:hypothetical protein